MSEKPSKRIEELFLNATDLPEEERAAYLDAECRDDPDTRKEVEKLLGHYKQADGKLIAKPVFNFTDSPDAPLKDPVSVGKYKVLRTIGVGGMGVVYEAEQENPHRTVAIKVIRPGIATKSMLSRFRYEAELLARLQHQGIAHIYEAGVVPVTFKDGASSKRPFFAMELINGKTLTDYAETNNLGTSDRLELMSKVCDAMRHAHQKGVIHRDLKPQNILVDNEGQPKILDFGVARAIDADIQTLTLRTGVGQLIGTVSYMSPEQVKGDSSNLDTRSDIYTLGVILFKLLTGQLPYDLESRTVPEAARIIQEKDPTRLSSIQPSLRGDLETIVQKALEKERDRRYQSAAQMSSDIQHYLNDEPILARPQSKIYQIRKFAKRNVGLVSGIIIAFLALIVGTTIAINQAILAKEKAERALTALDEAETITTFLTDMLTSADPFQEGEEMLVRDVLKGAAKKMEDLKDSHPLVKARIHQALGQAYLAIGEIQPAEENLSAAYKIQKESLGMRDDQTLSTALHLGKTFLKQDRYEEASPLIKEALRIRTELYGEEDLRTLSAVSWYGNLLRDLGEYEKSEAQIRKALKGYEKVLGPDDKKTMIEMDALAGLLHHRGKADDAEAMYRRALKCKIKNFGEEHLHTAITLGNLGVLLKEQGRLEEAAPLFEKTLKIRQKHLGEYHWQTLSAVNSLGVLWKARRDYKKAEDLFRQALKGYEKSLGPEHSETLCTLNNLGGVLMNQGKLDEAETCLNRALEGRIKSCGEDHPELLTSYNNLGILRMYQKRMGESEECFVKLLKSCQHHLGNNHLKTAITLQSLGAITEKQEKLSEAAEYYIKAIDAFKNCQGATQKHVIQTIPVLRKILKKLGRDKEAAYYKEMLKKSQSLD